MDHVEEFSRGVCMSKCVPQMIGVIVFLAMSVMFFTIDINDRGKVKVQIIQSVSSHIKKKLSTSVSTTQQVVKGVNMTPETHTTTETYYVKDANDNDVAKTRTQCLGDRYKYTTSDNIDIYANCPAYSGGCAGPAQKDLVYDTRTQSVTCKPNDFKYSCRLKATMEDNTEQEIVCPYSTCPMSGELEFPVKLATNALECPENLSGKYNTCTMSISHNSKEYPWREQLQGDCENLVGKTRDLYYSEETDDFQERWNAPYVYLRTVAIVTLLIAIVLSIHIVLTVKVDMYCHVQNIASGLTHAKTQLSGMFRN